MTDPALPQRSEIWLINFDPTVGTEIKKIRPAVVLSANAIGKLPIKLVAPVTDWKPYFERNLWHVKIEPDVTNGLNLRRVHSPPLGAQESILNINYSPNKTKRRLSETPNSDTPSACGGVVH